MSLPSSYVLLSDDNGYNNKEDNIFGIFCRIVIRQRRTDENDPANYIFEPTDEYVKRTVAVGTEPYYRLGASIEHGFKFGTRPPKDFNKWARICEYIIAHYTEGWANGFTHDMLYWEIWNEADGIALDD